MLLLKNRIGKLAKENKLMKDFFTVLRVHRDDLKERGFKNADKLTDEQMEIIAANMADGIMESSAFWDALEASAEASNLKN